MSGGKRVEEIINIVCPVIGLTTAVGDDGSPRRDLKRFTPVPRVLVDLG